MTWPWDELGLPGPETLPVIRRAYAKRLKMTRPDENPEGFQRLHNAYQEACRLARTKEKADPVHAPGERQTGEPDWDFERLFAEGEAQARGRRFQKALELRQKNRLRYETWQPAPSLDCAEMAVVWISVFRALTLIEEMAVSGADINAWKKFYKSKLFAFVRTQPDFVFGLEDILQEYPEFPEAGYSVLWDYYGTETLRNQKEYRLLYDILAEKAPRPPVPDGDSIQKRYKRKWTLVVILALVMLGSLLGNIGADYLVERDAQKEKVCAWLSEDFGGIFNDVNGIAWGKWIRFFDKGQQAYFQAAQDGTRDVRAGKRGYVTNYTQVLVAQELTAFSEKYDCSLGPHWEEGQPEMSSMDWNSYFLSIPLTGAGERITELGRLLSNLPKKAWYRQLPPDYTLYLGWQDWSFYAYDAKDGEFDAKSLRNYYERFFGADLCRIALKEAGLSDGGLLFSVNGTVQIGGRTFFQVLKTENPPVKTICRYFLLEDGKELFCVPLGRGEQGTVLQELRSMGGKEYIVKGFPEPLTVFGTEPS